MVGRKKNNRQTSKDEWSCSKGITGNETNPFWLTGVLCPVAACKCVVVALTECDKEEKKLQANSAHSALCRVGIIYVESNSSSFPLPPAHIYSYSSLVWKTPLRAHPQAPVTILTVSFSLHNILICPPSQISFYW